MLSIKDIRQELHGASVISDKVIEHIHKEGVLKIWVPKKYGGLGYRFGEGLKHYSDGLKPMEALAGC